MSTNYDLVCLSHLRWNFVFQRPQHLLTRCAIEHRVFFVEEPIYTDSVDAPTLDIREDETNSNIIIAVPHLPHGYADPIGAQSALIDQLLANMRVERFVLWYYTPMAIPLSSHLKPLATIYDCMDQLSAFKGASPDLISNEQELFKKADLVFTGGQSLYEAKRSEHPHVFAFPSSVDAAHFAQALSIQDDPSDQAEIARPRAGFFGVIDERLDIDLLGEVADLRPDVHFVMIGPVVKIDPETLPKRSNIHYLGGKSYPELPHYLAGWDVAMMPFAMNESTEFISPTKTPEYLAAGCPVVSTPIRDVVRPYQELQLVHIAADANHFAQAIDAALAEDQAQLQKRVEDFLSLTSWDKTWQRMSELIDMAIASESPTPTSIPNFSQGVTENQDTNLNVDQPLGAASVSA